jgi:Mg-chelatase subunit ChlD
VRQGIRINLAQIQSGNEEAMFAQVQRVAQLSQKAIDILLLVDISGSMNDK